MLVGDAVAAGRGKSGQAPSLRSERMHAAAAWGDKRVAVLANEGKGPVGSHQTTVSTSG